MSPQPIVITTSEVLTASVVRIFGCSPAMSMPSSAIAWTATGLIASAGADGHLGVPKGWMRRVKADLVTLGPEVVAARMVRDYVTQLYEPTATAADSLRTDEFAGARELAAWKARVRADWSGCKVLDVTASDEPASVGAEREVTVTVELGALSPDDVVVEAVAGKVGAYDELTETTARELPCADATAHPVAFSGTLPPATAGRRRRPRRAARPTE